MSNLKLDKLPDRTPCKITIQLEPKLMKDLQDYASIYAREYDESTSPAELVPFHGQEVHRNG